MAWLSHPKGTGAQIGDAKSEKLKQLLRCRSPGFCSASRVKTPSDSRDKSCDKRLPIFRNFRSLATSMKFRSPLMPFFFNMKVLTAVRMLMPLVVGLIFTCPQAGAQNLVLSVKTSTNSVVVSNSVTYTINLTNQTGVLLQNVSVTNALSAQFMLLSATNLQGSILTNSAIVVFNLVQLVGGGFAQMTMTVAPTTVGIRANILQLIELGLWIGSPADQWKSILVNSCWVG